MTQLHEHTLRKWASRILFAVTIALTAFLGYQLNRTARVATEAQIKADRQTLRTELVVASSPNALIMCNETGEVVLSNYAAEIMLGYGHDELIGLPTTSLMPENKRARHIIGMQRAALKMKAYKEGDWVLILDNAEFEAMHKSGVLVPVTVSIRVIRFMGEVEFIVTMALRAESEEPNVPPPSPLPTDKAVPLPEISENVNIERAKSQWAANQGAMP